MCACRCRGETQQQQQQQQPTAAAEPITLLEDMEHGGLDFGSMAAARLGASATAQPAAEAVAAAAAVAGKKHKEKKHKEKKHKKHKHKKEKRQKKGERGSGSFVLRCRLVCMHECGCFVSDAVRGWSVQGIACGPDQVPVMKMTQRLRQAALSLKSMLSRMATWCGRPFLLPPPMMPAPLSLLDASRRNCPLAITCRQGMHWDLAQAAPRQQPLGR